MKELAMKLLSARNVLRRAEDALLAANAAYQKAERDYLDGIGDQHMRALVVCDIAISVAPNYPDSRPGSHLGFEEVEVLS